MREIRRPHQGGNCSSLAESYNCLPMGDLFLRLRPIPIVHLHVWPAEESCCCFSIALARFGEALTQHVTDDDGHPLAAVYLTRQPSQSPD